MRRTTLALALAALLPVTAFAVTAAPGDTAGTAPAAAAPDTSALGK